MSLLLLQAPASGNALLQFLPLILIFGIFYFLLFLPMQRQKKQQQKMLSELKNGDEVLTNGGIVGTIVAINSDDTIDLKIKPNDTRLRFARGSVANRIEPDKKS